MPEKAESSMEKTDGMSRPHPSLPMAPPLGRPPSPPPPHPPTPPPLPHSPPLPPPPPHQPYRREPQPPLPAVPEPPSDIDGKGWESRTTAEISKSVLGADSSQKWVPSGEVMKEGGEKEDSGAKIKMSFGSKRGVLGKRPGGMISMKLKPQTEPDAKKTKLEAAVPSKSSSKLAQAFGSDSEEEEEMPPEAKLRMRNIGKNTPTSAGPNSFNKTQRGFSDPKSTQAWRQTE